jgi:hypothetical protein
MLDNTELGRWMADCCTINRIDGVTLKTCPLFATGADGRSERYHVLAGAGVRASKMLLRSSEQVATEGFFIETFALIATELPGS